MLDTSMVKHIKIRHNEYDKGGRLYGTYFKN